MNPHAVLDAYCKAHGLKPQYIALCETGWYMLSFAQHTAYALIEGDKVVDYQVD